MRVLNGHTSEETAYLVDDYPYGYSLRCKIRYWIETTSHGQRFCSQTTNPKKPIEVWNKPKKSTYVPIAVMYLDEQNHVQWDGLSMYADEAKEKAFVEKFADGLGDKYRTDTLRLMRIARERMAKQTWVIKEGGGE